MSDEEESGAASLASGKDTNPPNHRLDCLPSEILDGGAFLAGRGGIKKSKKKKKIKGVTTPPPAPKLDSVQVITSISGSNSQKAIKGNVDWGKYGGAMGCKRDAIERGRGQQQETQPRGTDFIFYGNKKQEGRSCASGNGP